MKEVAITISWDDNHSKNLKLVKLLNKYNLKGTFYLYKAQDINQSKNDIIKISLSQEIGSHSLTHSDLTGVNLKQAKKEILGSKEWLETLINKPVKVFAYPFGFYDDQVKKIVKQSGFISARTARSFNHQCPKDFFAWHPTIQIYPYPFRKRNDRTMHWSSHLLDPLWHNFFGFIGWHLPITAYLNWISLAKATFDHVYKNGGTWHLWGHCYEVEKYNMWQDLEEIFSYISNRKNIFYLTNGQLFDKLYHKNYVKK